MMLPNASPEDKFLVLGTALWGWGVDKETAFRLLDEFVLAGGKVIDTATNYPINKQSENYGLALKWISEWITKVGRNDISILVKIGSTDNLGGSGSNLTPTFIRQTEDFLYNQLRNSLSAISIHWDNRGEDPQDDESIIETVEELSRIINSGLSVGLSGIKYPKFYFDAAPELADRWWIQVKLNAFSNAAYQHYSPLFPNARYLAYGINMGGIKLESQKNDSSISLRGITQPNKIVEKLSAYINSDHGLRPSPQNLNELALTTSYLNPALSGVIIGPRDTRQLLNSYSFWTKLKQESEENMSAKLPSLLM